jgi:hypothetical protein
MASIKQPIYIGLTEQGVYTYPDPRMEGWRYYRIEYCGFNEECKYEGSIWLPPHVDPFEVEDLFKKWQSGK